MVRTQHRRRLPASGVFAVLAPICAVLLSSYAFVADLPWARVAAVVGAVAAAVLGALVLQLQRRLRTDVASVRASQAAAYDALYARYAADHRDFTAHMVGLLDLADERLTVLRRRLDAVQAGLGATVQAGDPQAPDSTVGAGGEQWDQLWPDLSELPTVVDLLSWEERSRHGLVPQTGTEGGIQTA